MKRKNIGIFISWTVVILWMLLIFNLSSQVALQSDKLSTGVTEIVIKTIEKVAPKADFDIGEWNHIIRKNTHFFAYLILGVLVLNSLRRSGAAGLKRSYGFIDLCSLCC